MDEIKNKFADAFDIKFIVQIGTIVVLAAIAWANVVNKLDYMTEKVNGIIAERVISWAEQKHINEKVDTRIIALENAHTDIIRRMDILITELQNGKYCRGQ